MTKLVGIQCLISKQKTIWHMPYSLQWKLIIFFWNGKEKFLWEENISLCLSEFDSTILGNDLSPSIL